MRLTNHDFAPVSSVYQDYQAELVAAGLLIPLGVPGLYGRSGAFERVVEHFERYVTRMGAHLEPEVMHFPPLLARRDYLCTGHQQNFPDLMGSVHSFAGSERDHLMLQQKQIGGEDWTRDAACHSRRRPRLGGDELLRRYLDRAAPRLGA